mgnify:CR=1 FL=1
MFLFKSQVKEVPVSDKHGLTRSIGVRFTHQYPLENNEWGEFQVQMGSIKYLWKKHEYKNSILFLTNNFLYFRYLNYDDFAFI